MGLTFRFSEALDDFLDGYNARLLMSSEQLFGVDSGGKSTRHSYLHHWKPFATVFRDAISDFEDCCLATKPATTSASSKLL